MDDEEERRFLDRLAHRVWKARKEGVNIGAAFVLGIGFFLSSSRSCPAKSDERVSVCSRAGGGLSSVAARAKEALRAIRKPLLSA